MPVAAIALAGPVDGRGFASEGQPDEAQIGFQTSVTPIMDEIESFHNGLLIWIVSAIVILVLAL